MSFKLCSFVTYELIGWLTMDGGAATSSALPGAAVPPPHMQPRNAELRAAIKFNVPSTRRHFGLTFAGHMNLSSGYISSWLHLKAKYNPQNHVPDFRCIPAVVSLLLKKAPETPI